jgi:hypothetical protein
MCTHTKTTHPRYGRSRKGRGKVPGRDYHKKGGLGGYMREVLSSPRREGVSSSAYPLTAPSTRKRTMARSRGGRLTAPSTALNLPFVVPPMGLRG